MGTPRSREAGRPSAMARAFPTLLGVNAARPAVLGFLLASCLTVVLGAWVFALPLMVMGLAAKAAAALAWMGGRTTRAAGRLGIALLLDCAALLSWGRHLLTAPLVPLIGLLGVTCAALALARLRRWEALERHQWAVRQEMRRSQQPVPPLLRPPPSADSPSAGGADAGEGGYWESSSRQ